MARGLCDITTNAEVKGMLKHCYTAWREACVGDVDITTNAEVNGKLGSVLVTPTEANLKPAI